VTPKRAARIAAFVTLGVVGAVSFGRATVAGVWDLLINARSLPPFWVRHSPPRRGF
jgi:hypothetical protein